MRLLFITYEFPPKGGPQSQHVAKLALGLVDNGWDVTVLTVEDPPAPMSDTALLREVEGRVRIERAWSLEPTRLVQAVRRMRRGASTSAPEEGPAAGVRSFTSLPRWAIRLVQAFFIPDEKIGWKRWALRRALELHEAVPFDAVLSSGPPFSAHVIGRAFARRTKVPWIADFRDPLVDNVFFKPPTSFHASSMRRLERSIALEAGAVVTATEPIAEAVQLRNKEAVGRVHYLPNTFDPADFAEEVQPVRDRFLVSYVGQFQGGVNPKVFLQALADAMEREPRLAEDVHVRFVGAADAETLRTVESLGMQEIVEMTGYLSHAEAVRAMRESSVNLFILSPAEESRAILTSKLPEYLGAKRPVFALAPEGVATSAVRAAGAGVVVPPTDVAAAADGLLELYARWARDELPEPDAGIVERYDRDIAVAGLSELLRELAGAAR